MNWSSASGRKEIEGRLRKIGGQSDGEIPLGEAALLLAALDRPRVALERYAHHLSLLERDTAEVGASLGADESLSARIDALNDVIVERYGYEGDQRTYDDLQNANLMRVIDRRKGIPVTLGILYLHAARAQGWSATGLNFPGHFLLRLDLGGERRIIDPFHGGRICDTAAMRELLKALAGNDAELTPDHYAPVRNRDILLRVQGNIKLRLLQDRRTGEALEIVETMLMIAPDNARLWREAGLQHSHLGNLRAAMIALEHYRSLSQDSQERYEATKLLEDLKAHLN